MSISRRSLLTLLGIGVFAAGCAAPAASPTSAPVPTTAPTAPSAKPTAAATAKPAATAAPEKPPTQAPAKPKSLQEVTFRLNWRAIGYHAPFWAAVDKGFYAEQGLNVKLFEGQGSGPTLQLVASGTQMFGLIDSGVVAQGIQKGVDVRLIAGLVNRNMYGILSPKDAPFRKPEDLLGKNLAGIVGGAGELQWPAFVKKTGIDASKVNIITVDAPGKYAAMLARRVHGAFHEVPTDALTYEDQGFAVERLLYSDYGLDRLGFGLAALNKTIGEQRETVRGFVAGSLKGWKYALENPEASVAIGKKLFDTPLTPETLAKQWKATFEFHASKRTKDRPLGWMETPDWDDTQKLLVDAGFLESSLPVDKYFTNDFVPKS